jgi:hypothetical protein
MTNRTDTFNRADTTNAIGTPSDGGSAWSQVNGTWGIASNTAYSSSAGSESHCALESSVSAVEVEATLTVVDSQCGLTGRLADVNNYITVIVEAPQARLFKYVAGVYTQLGSTYTATMNNGVVIKLRMDSANDITVYVDGVSRITANDAAGSSNTQHGLRIHASGNTRFDNFSITAISGTILDEDGEWIISTQSW